MKRAWIRLLGFCVSIFGMFIGKNACALIEDVWMQCELNEASIPVTGSDGGEFVWTACDDGSSFYYYANGENLMKNYFSFCKSSGDYVIIPIFTGIDGNSSSTPCYCDTTGIACPNTLAWRTFLNNQGCTEGWGDYYGDSCYYVLNKRGLYAKFQGCAEGYAETTGVLPQHVLITSKDDWSFDPTGYCYKCPGLGYDGDSFYLTTGMSPSGQFSWGAGPQSGDGCQAKVNGSLTNSKGTFTVTEPCEYDEYYYQ